MLKTLIVYRHAFVIGVATSLALFSMQGLGTWWGVFASVGLWLALIAVLFRRGRKRGRSYAPYVPLIATSSISFMALTSLIEVTVLRYFLDAVGGIALFLIITSAIRDAYGMRSGAKEWRRVQMMLWVFAVYACGTTLFALVLFFSSIPVIFFAVVMGVLAGYSAQSVWVLYLAEEDISYRVWAVLLGSITAQLFFVGAYALPFGYLALGLLLVWVWYIAQLLIRFHLSHKGILWKRQRLFLLANGILYALLLFRFIRWI